MEKKPRYFIFSDESGSWHDENEIYVRSWVAVPESECLQLINKVDELAQFIETQELSWQSFAGQPAFFNAFDGISFRIFITVSSPKDIKWETKYKITKGFNESISSFDFGDLDEQIIKSIKEKILRDIKNELFMHFYERCHILNAKKGIEGVIKPAEYELVWKVDPPQLPRRTWGKILEDLSKSTKIDLEFPSSHRTQGIQFADIIAGCFRSLMLKDSRYSKSCEFFKHIKPKMIRSQWGLGIINPNPNLIFYSEINNDLKQSWKHIWKL